MCILVVIVQFRQGSFLESKHMLVLSTKSFRDLPDLLTRAASLLNRGRPEHNTKFDLSVLCQQLQLHVLDESLEQSGESLKHLVLHGHASAALSERATYDFLV